jgi:hypothetical protein
MAWQLLAGALRAALPAAGRALGSSGVKGEVTRTAASSLLSGNSGGATRPGNSSLSMSQNKAGNSPIGQLPKN